MQVDIYIAPDVNALLRFLGGFARGGRAILFCEDRLTLEAERAVAAGGAVFGVTVTSFARFLGEKEGKKVLSKQGSVMVVGAIAAKNKDKLRCFGRNPAGCAVRLYETIAQLRAALVTPDTYAVHIEKSRRDVEGGYPYLAHSLAKALPETVTVLNREEDLGVPGLRKAKHDWFPLYQLEKGVYEIAPFEP